MARKNTKGKYSKAYNARGEAVWCYVPTKEEVENDAK